MSRCTLPRERAPSDQLRAITKELIEKIESLPADKRAEVERLVDSFQPSYRLPRFSKDLFDRVNERRERLRRQHGFFDSVSILRELREHGD